MQGKKLPKSVEEAEDEDGEVSDEDEAADLVQPKPEEGAAAAEPTGKEVRGLCICMYGAHIVCHQFHLSLLSKLEIHNISRG